MSVREGGGYAADATRNANVPNTPTPAAASTGRGDIV
jgi:hypothetical protein